MASASSDGSLVDWAQRLADAADMSAVHRANEEELRLDLNPVIVQAAGDLYGLDALSSTAECSGHRSVRRHYDNLYGGVVVEWEWDMGRSRRDHGTQQALDYLSDLRRQVGAEEVFTAVVCDGRQWGFLVVDPDEQNTLLDAAPATASDYFEWRPNTPASCRRFLELIGSNRQQPITGSALRSAFGPDSNTTRTLVILLAEGLAGRSGDGRIDVLYREWRRALDVVYGNLDVTSGDIAEVVADVYGLRIERPVGEYLFVLHTYFALVARLFAIELLAITTEDRIRQPTAWISVDDNELIERLHGFDHGKLPGGLQIDNLFESDVFGWWLALSRGNTDLLSALRNVLSALANFAFPRTIHGPQRAADVLSELYQSLVPRQMRRNLGEFLTPHWLAQACLERLRSLGAPINTGRVIDPTCGTGTFLMPILSDRLSNLRRAHAQDDITSQMVQGLLDSVAGIDINPVAVTATRVNYVLALSALASSGALTLPVWRADSLLVPDSPPRQGKIDEGAFADREFRELRTSLQEPFRVPPLLSTAERMAVLRHLLEESLRNESEDEGRETLLMTLDERYGPTAEAPATADLGEWDNERIIVSILYDQMRLLQEQGKNGIWAQIIANAYAPLFAGRYDIVVGNPPWLAWGRLPEAWRQGSQQLWNKYGLWRLPAVPGDTGGLFQVGDIAQLVYAVALDRYAADHAYVGLLTPLAILIADPGARAFRRFELVSDPSYAADCIDIHFRILGVDDWSHIQPFAPIAANQPVFVVSLKGQNNAFPVPGWRWTRRESIRSLEGEWRRVNISLTAESGEYRPANPDVPTSAWSFRPEGAPEMLRGGSNQWDFGVGLHTRGANGIFFIRIIRTMTAQGRVEIENIPAEGRNPDVRRRRGQVESDLVYPLLRGRDVSAWRAEPTQFIIVPHYPDHFDEVISDVDLSSRGRFPLAGAWLRQFRGILRNRRPPPNRVWDMDGNDWCRIEGPMNYIRGRHIVVVREISGHPAAAVVEQHFVGSLGRSVAPLVDHKLLFCFVPTHDEAIYLTAFINSTPAQDFLASFVNTVGVTPRALKTLPIPAFDTDNQDVMTLATCGNSIAASPPDERGEVIEREREAIDSAVVNLGNLNPNTYQPQPRRPPRRRRSRTFSNEMTLPGMELFKVL